MPTLKKEIKDAIALEWLRQQDLSSLSPAETYKKFLQAYEEINEESVKSSKPARIG